jgi:predicted DNA-binding transcriptional regulator YafY
MNRFNRVTAILIQLQTRKVVRAKDIAERFNVSTRTVYRDIQTLVEAGVPVGSEAGVGYYLADGYRLPPVMFTKEEVTSFLTAEKFVEKFTDRSIDVNFKSGMMKIRAILKSTEKEMLENIEENIEVLKRGPRIENSGNSNYIQMLVDSISNRKSLKIRYHTFYSNEVKDRNIEPIGIFFSGGYWHTIAFCELRQDYRDFRLDRILNITKTENSFIKEHPSIKDYLGKVSKEQNLETITIRVDKEVTQYINDQKYYNGFITEEDFGDTVQMTFLTSSTQYFVRWFLMFADRADIISPESLKKMLNEKISEIESRMKS